MKIKLVGILLFSYFILTSQTLVNGENKDYLSTGDQLTFLNENYELVWSSNPITGYYKQEYLRSKDKLTKFSKMLIIDAVESNISADEAARLKSKDLDRLKKDNPMINYNTIKNSITQEVILDFVISDKAYIYEWNMYKFEHQEYDGKNYMVTFCYVYRDSLNDNEELKTFFNHITNNKTKVIYSLGEYVIPQIKI